MIVGTWEFDETCFCASNMFFSLCTPELPTIFSSFKAEFRLQSGRLETMKKETAGATHNRLSVSSLNFTPIHLPSAMLSVYPIELYIPYCLVTFASFSLSSLGCITSVCEMIFLTVALRRHIHFGSFIPAG